MNRNKVRGINRVVALLLAAVWSCAGVAGIVLGYIHNRWLLISISVFALWYALLWSRVVVRSQLLTWRELAVPWRAALRKQLKSGGATTRPPTTD